MTLKSHLSMYEITTLVALAHLMENIEEILKKDVDKEEHRDLSCLRTYTKKYIGHVKERIDKKTDDRLHAKVKNYIPKLMPVRREGEEVFTLAQDDFYDMVEQVMAVKCCDCPGVPDCRIREVLQDNFIPMLTVSDDKNICEYMFKFTDLQINQEDANETEKS